MSPPGGRQGRSADRHGDPYPAARAEQARRREELERARGPGPPAATDWVAPSGDGETLRAVGAPETVGRIANGLVSRRRWGQRLEAATLTGRWRDVVGDDLAARCRPTRFEGGVLTVAADDQVWATQLEYFRPAIRDRANRLLASATVDRVRITVEPDPGGAREGPRA